jgi:UDP-N-acetylglucosamine--N-acetylmuramyl-(pentapeptide) pyrophosphoryl-undecaprenol N-acetylglucosamine transferase
MNSALHDQPLDAASPRVSSVAHRATIVFAGGGSGGHISPGLAIAERVRELAPQARLVFVCSSRVVDAEMLREAEATFVPLDARPFSLRPWRLISSLSAFRRARMAAGDILERESAGQVVALGGFVSAPVAAAARRRNIPVTLFNLDAKPGLANRWLAGRSDRVLSAVPTTGSARFARQVADVVGMPLRRLAIAPGEPPECRVRLGLDPGRPTLLVTGASQGSRSVNRLMALIARRRPELLRGWQVLHLAGSGDLAPLIEAYQEGGILATALPFLHRMGLAWGAADVAISRAGASSVAEAEANAVPTLFLPYPYHRDLHQRLNAEPLVRRGAALMELDQVDPERNLTQLAPALERLLLDSDARSAMRSRLRSAPPRDAAATVAHLLLDE